MHPQTSQTRPFPYVGTRSRSLPVLGRTKSPTVRDFTGGVARGGGSAWGTLLQTSSFYAYLRSKASRSPQVFSGAPGVTGSPAQQAVEAVLLREAGVPLVSSGDVPPGSALGPAPGTSAYAAAQRFAALSPGAPPGLAWDAPARAPGRQGLRCADPVMSVRTYEPPSCGSRCTGTGSPAAVWARRGCCY